MKPGRITLKPGREKSLRLRHPWVFSGAIAHVEGNPPSGETVVIAASTGEFLAYAAWSPESQIRARAWSFDEKETVGAALFAKRLRSAVGAREGRLDAEHNGCRIVHGESDLLPGFIADRYGEVLVVQILSAGAERWREALIDAALAASGCTSAYERSDADVRQLEALPVRCGWMRGGGNTEVTLLEGGIRFCVDIEKGQKTGFFLDQRDNRKRVQSLCAGARVLDAFCHTGGFALNAARGGANEVLAIDSSSSALAVAERNEHLNSIQPGIIEWREADVFAELRRLRDRAEIFDVIILDPPKFAPTAQHAERAARAYKDINLLALKLLRKGGRLVTFSCSGGVSAELFQKIVAGAALDAHVDASIVARLGPSSDHPIALSFPEGDYLKGLILRTVN